MPVQECTKDGKKGHKWGERGVCYTGRESEALARRQGAAIEADKARRQK